MLSDSAIGGKQLAALTTRQLTTVETESAACVGPSDRSERDCRVLCDAIERRM